MVCLVDNYFYLAITTVFMLSTSWNTRLLTDSEDHLWWQSSLTRDDDYKQRKLLRNNDPSAFGFEVDKVPIHLSE